MKISLCPATVSAGEIAGLLALLATTAPAALTQALDGLREDGSGLTDASRIFASAPMPDLSTAMEDEDDAPQANAPAAPPQPDTSASVTPASPPSPPPAGASSPPTPAAPSPAGATLDKEGLPWDARIHATVEGGGGKITAAGVWRAKRGVSADEKARVAAELKAALAAPQAQPAAPPPPPPPAAPPAEAPPPASVPVSPAPPAEPAPSAPPAPAAPPVPASGPAAFAALMGKVTTLQTGGRLTAEDVNAALQGVGLAALRDLLARPDLMAGFEATVDALTKPGA